MIVHSYVSLTEGITYNLLNRLGKDKSTIYIYIYIWTMIHPLFLLSIFHGPTLRCSPGANWWVPVVRRQPSAPKSPEGCGGVSVSFPRERRKICATGWILMDIEKVSIDGYWWLILVGGAITILRNISQWEGLSHILWKIKTCLKPPTSIIWILMDIDG